MICRIEISTLPGFKDIKAETAKQQIKDIFNKNIADMKTRDVYTISANITKDEVVLIGSELVNPVIQKVKIGVSFDLDYDWILIVGFLPGVTDNIGKTAFLAVGDILGRKLKKSKEKIFSSTEYLFKGKELEREDIKQIAESLLANELIQTITILSKNEVDKNKLPDNIPYVKQISKPGVKEVNFDVSDEKLIKISKKGILALSLKEMKAIQFYFKNAKNRTEIGLNNNPTDVELECIAQTWSEHCSHKVFDAEIEYEDENGKIEKIVSCFRTFIVKSTDEIAEEVDWLVSVFHDNAGVIAFNDSTDIVFKVETHNSPSALDPYGGAMTGIVGVNRDPMGTGMGAELLINVWGYCLGSPFTDKALVPKGLLHPRRLRDGIHKGVIDGGNQSGIPYGNGWEYFDERYTGKPLVFCGTVGKLPKKIGDVKGFEKEILSGDLIVMAGGRIGKDGIHGATFSSEELHKDSPVQAVQIGDPITQKMMGDFIYEARDRRLYRFVTDNGAGGLSSSIGEMAKECGGCKMDLGKASVKYAGLNPWEILVSEAQERMSFAVPEENIKEFKALAKAREIEISVLGRFTDSGKIHLLFNGKTVALMDINFLYGGCPKMQLKAKWIKPKWSEPTQKELIRRNISKDMLNLILRLNICTNEFKGRQYDHEVKGLSVIKPFIGKNRDVKNDVGIFMLEPLGREGIVLASAVLPRYSDIDTYHMMASVIDLAVRRSIAAGADFNRMAGLDNFCWPDPVQSEKTPDGEYKLAQLVRANKALYDYTKIFKTPCISGKDSMKNDSTKGGKKISIPPTVLFSTIAKISDIDNAVSLDAKFAGDAIYIIGETKPELGGSEYFAMLGYTGNNVPKVDGNRACLLYKAINKLTHRSLVRSITVPELGGLGVAFAKMAMGGNLGLDIDISKIPSTKNILEAELIFSETNSRFVITVAKEKMVEFEKVLNSFNYSKIGEVIEEPEIRLGKYKLTVRDLKRNYKVTLDGI